MKLWQRRELKRTKRSILCCIRERWGREDRSASFFDGENFKKLCLPGLRTQCAAYRRRTFRLRLEPETVRVRALPWSARTYASTAVIQTPLKDEAALRPFVEEGIARGVKLFAAIGPDSMGVEHEIDRIMVGDQFDPSRSRLTTSHPTLVDALCLINAMNCRKRFYEVWI